jgi:hypothetical protein
MEDTAEAVPEWKGEMNVKYTFGGKLKGNRYTTVFW